MKVLAGGCFNKIHPGHVYFLKKAKALGYLTVILTHDKNNKKPYAKKAGIRKKNLQKLGIADKIIIGHATDFWKVVKKINPDIIVLGYDQELPEQLKDRLRKTKIIRIKKFGRFSSKSS